MKWVFVLLSFSVYAAGFLDEGEIAQFYEQGYVVKKGALDGDEIAVLDRLLDEVVERVLQEPIEGEGDQFLYFDGSRAVVAKREDGSVAVKRINGCAGMEPRLDEFMCSEKMLQSFFEILGVETIEHIIAQVHPKLPGDGVEFPGHRDIQFRKSFDPEWQDVTGKGSYAICIIAVDTMRESNGGLWVEVEGERVWVDLDPGDLLFMHPYLYHGSGSNLSPTQKRRTLLTGFCAYGANHKPYPGARVNELFSSTEEGIVKSDAPWKEIPFTGPGFGH